jgi:hypothetical protein
MEWVQGAEHKSSAWVMQFQAGREDVTDKKNCSTISAMWKK